MDRVHFPLYTHQPLEEEIQRLLCWKNYPGFSKAEKGDDQGSSPVSLDKRAFDAYKGFLSTSSISLQNRNICDVRGFPLIPFAFTSLENSNFCITKDFPPNICSEKRNMHKTKDIICASYSCCPLRSKNSCDAEETPVTFYSLYSPIEWYVNRTKEYPFTSYSSTSTKKVYEKYLPVSSFCSPREKNAGNSDTFLCHSSSSLRLGKKELYNTKEFPSVSFPSYSQQNSLHNTKRIIFKVQPKSNMGPDIDDSRRKMLNEEKRSMECAFCKKNGDRKCFYQTHMLKDPVTGNVVCPILRGHICEFCGATGDNSHTRSYCPLAKIKCVGNTASLKESPRDSTGKIRSLKHKKHMKEK